MIIEQGTYRWFGYYPKDLKPCSEKKILVFCNECGNIRIISKHGYHDLCSSCVKKEKYPSKKTRLRMSKSRKLRKIQPMAGKHHTKYTKEKMSKMHKGELHPNWKGGISGKSYEECFNMTMIEWKEYAIKIRKRDKYICQYCGKKRSIEVHHIMPRHIKIDNHPDNLITLCKSCHIKVEHLTSKFIDQNRNPIEIFYEKWSKQ